jgi:hypothetical protein
MRTTSYLSSARVYSLVMLLAVYLDLGLARTQLERNGWLNEARHVYVLEYLRNPSHQAVNAPQDVVGVGAISVTEGNAYSHGQSVPGWIVSVRRTDGRQWRASVPKQEMSEQSEKASAEKLQRIAADLGLKDVDKVEVGPLFRSIERESADRKVTVPGVDLAFRPDVAPWAIALLTLGFLVLIRNQTRRVLADKDLALDEPWIVLDGDLGLERLVAGGWLLAIWAAPWLASGCLLGVFSSQIIVDGAVTTWPKEVLACVASLLMVLSGGWASLTATADLLRLRCLRRARLDELTSADIAP